MKAFVSFFIFAIFAFGAPSWYHAAFDVKPNHYVGFGEGESEAEAKQNALNDIASQMNTKIDSEVIQNKKQTDGSFSKNIEFKSIQKIKATLSDYDVQKFEKQNGRYFFKIEYENISNIDRLIKKLSIVLDANATSAKDKKSNFLQRSSIAKKINEHFAKDIALQIQRQNNAWNLKSNGITQIINDDEFSKFFVTIADENLSIATSKKDNVLYDGDEFWYKINSKNSGFASVVSVYEDGTVCTLIKNHKIKSGVNILPDDKHGSIPTAGLLVAGSETFEMVFVILSDKKLMFDNFADSSVETNNQEKYKNFGEFVEFLNDKKFATAKVITKPR